MKMPAFLSKVTAKIQPKHRQWIYFLGGIAGAIGILTAIFTAATPAVNPATAAKKPVEASKVTNVGVMAPGEQVSHEDQWLGDAGRKLSAYEREREDQDRVNKENAQFRDQVLKRFATLDDTVNAHSNAIGANSKDKQAAAPAAGTPTAPPPVPIPGAGSAPAGPPPPPPRAGTTPVGAMPQGMPGMAGGDLAAPPQLVRVSLGADKAHPVASTPGSSTPAATAEGSAKKRATVDTFLPVSVTRGVMLGGLDAPTGGQSQSNPHPILIRLEDNAILPNRFRSNVKECFVVGAAYGDIASERAYGRVETLSCVRNDGTALEVKVSGSVFGEDGHVGLRGRLVTKQGQMLANALFAGLLSGFGQGLSTYNTTTSTSAFGSVSTTDGSQAFKQGMGAGVGRAFERLANYYIKLAENTFPVIEVDAGRSVDVVITKGVTIEGGDVAQAEASPTSGEPRSPALLNTGANDDY